MPRVEIFKFDWKPSSPNSATYGPNDEWDFHPPEHRRYGTPALSYSIDRILHSASRTQRNHLGALYSATIDTVGDLESGPSVRCWQGLVTSNLTGVIEVVCGLFDQSQLPKDKGRIRTAIKSSPEMRAELRHFVKLKLGADHLDVVPFEESKETNSMKKLLMKAVVQHRLDSSEPLGDELYRSGPVTLHAKFDRPVIGLRDEEGPSIKKHLGKVVRCSPLWDDGSSAVEIKFAALQDAFNWFSAYSKQPVVFDLTQHGEDSDFFGWPGESSGGGHPGIFTRHSLATRRSFCPIQV